MKDLFEDYENTPSEVKEVFNHYPSFAEGESSYEELVEILEKVEKIGYTFEYYLDAVPYGLRPIGVEINQLEGFENI